MVMCLGQGVDLHMAQLMPLPLTISCSSKSRLVLPSWCMCLLLLLTVGPAELTAAGFVPCAGQWSENNQHKPTVARGSAAQDGTEDRR